MSNSPLYILRSQDRQKKQQGKTPLQIISDNEDLGMSIIAKKKSIRAHMHDSELEILRSKDRLRKQPMKKSLQINSNNDRFPLPIISKKKKNRSLMSASQLQTLRLKDRLKKQNKKDRMLITPSIPEDRAEYNIERNNLLVAQNGFFTGEASNCNINNSIPTYTFVPESMNTIMDDGGSNTIDSLEVGEITPILDVDVLSIGYQSFECQYCHAMMFKGEKSGGTLHYPKFNLCCRDGLIVLPLLQPSPITLTDLFSQKYDDSQSKFLDLIRIYNSMFSFTSMGGKIPVRTSGRGPQAFKISGANYHRIGTLLPLPNQPPRFAQLYIHDSSSEVEARLFAIGKSDKIKRHIVILLQNMLDEFNPYVNVFRQARNRLSHLTSNCQEIDTTTHLSLRILSNRFTDGRQYALPSSTEVAALIVGDGSEHVDFRDVIIMQQDGYLKRINETHPGYMALQYPLLFPFGEDGWRIGISYRNGKKSGRQTRVSIREYYSFRLQYRRSEQNMFLHSGKLFQQYIVDAYASIEQERLNWVRNNQKTLRSEIYRGLQDVVIAGDSVAGAIGQRFVLPSSFHGGPRDMYQNYQDAISICRWAGPPDYFITFTCNPRWNEIQEAIKISNTKSTEDRPDIISRVFSLKLKALLSDLKKKQIFGKVIADIYVVEFQKRGLPHAHILLTVSVEDKPKTTDQINKVVQAEIPDKLLYPRAHDIVRRHMIHGPCGCLNTFAPCMLNGICAKKFPKTFNNSTFIDKHGYVQYRRRDDGRQYILPNHAIVDNCWIVPYNMYLLLRYESHINVEICAHPKLIKYLYKYIHKGHDKSTIIIEDNNITAGEHTHNKRDMVDEIKQYLDCRYVSSVEGCWRIFEYTLHSHHPSIECLPFHLPDQQNVCFKEYDCLENVINNPNIEKTKLIGWFIANQRYQEAHELTFEQFPERWVWDNTSKEWRKRKQGRCIGRLYFAHPTSGDRFYLRMLLCIIKGACNFAEIRTVYGINYPTFKSACAALGLLEDDSEWHQALQEAACWSTASQLRVLFCSILMFSEPTDPRQLWDMHWKSLSEDFLHNRLQNNSALPFVLSDIELQNLAMLEIQKILNENGRSLTEFTTLFIPVVVDNQQNLNRLVREELNYDVSVAVNEYTELEQKLNPEQRNIFQLILQSSIDKINCAHFISGSGGTGKTFLYKTLIAKFRSENKIVITVASSGIAALLLPGGRTAHSRFKIPINLSDISTCSISHQSNLSELIQKAALIIWDEAPMLNRSAFEAVDRTFRDIMKYHNVNACDTIFGGKPIVFGGDFRQILPVVPKGGRELIVSSSLHRSHIWSSLRLHQLNLNMRLFDSNDDDIRQCRTNFLKWILDIGEGNITDTAIRGDAAHYSIEIPQELIVRGIEDLVNSVYPDLQHNFMETLYLEQRVILAPKNDAVDKINNYILSLISGEKITYYSADSIDQCSNSNSHMYAYPPEFLHSLKHSGMPNHCIELKVGVPIMLLRNLNQSMGLCNGTRLIAHKLSSKVIQAKIINGKHSGEFVLIPRVVMSPTDTDLPPSFRRRQFPIRLAFAMTINKSQGQTLQFVGLYLQTPVFCHGQLYVALSRCTSKDGIKILLTEDCSNTISKTINVVYREVIDATINSNSI